MNFFDLFSRGVFLNLQIAIVDGVTFKQENVFLGRIPGTTIQGIEFDLTEIDYGFGPRKTFEPGIKFQFNVREPMTREGNVLALNDIQGVSRKIELFIDNPRVNLDNFFIG